MPYIDFAAVKDRVTIQQAVEYLGLDLKQSGNQLRGFCPACKSSDPRALTVTPLKGLFICFSAPAGSKRGGDCIALVQHIRSVDSKAAAEELAQHFQTVQVTRTSNSTVCKTRATAPQGQPARSGFDPVAYAAKLDTQHELLGPLGISPETLKEFSSGYSGSGINRGKLAIALTDRSGAIVGFAGRALDQPHLTFPQGFDPHTVIFNAHRVQGEVRMVRDPLDVMRAHEVGEIAICFLSDTVEAGQLEMLASVLDTNKATLFI